ncbi:MAG: hypothetical protein JWR37_5743, partial [Mycobacterium sp.]|nr:hypothetical protein [Mycobacterium sp.]
TAAAADELTAPDRQVARLAADGLSNHEIENFSWRSAPGINSPSAKVELTICATAWTRASWGGRGLLKAEIQSIDGADLHM